MGTLLRMSFSRELQYRARLAITSLALCACISTRTSWLSLWVLRLRQQCKRLLLHPFLLEPFGYKLLIQPFLLERCGCKLLIQPFLLEPFGCKRLLLYPFGSEGCRSSRHRERAVNNMASAPALLEQAAKMTG